MRLLFIVACVVGCTDASQLDGLKEDGPIVCWSYAGCANGAGNPIGAPTVPIEQGLSCMNDALANGTLAMATWSTDNFFHYTEDQTYVFADDHEVRVFTSHRSEDGSTTVREGDGCSGPFRIADVALCSTTVEPRTAVKVLAWNGCP